jgi:HlyD family secretion protein
MIARLLPALAEPLDDATLSATLRNAILALVILALGFFGVASIVPIGSAVVGSGRVGPETRVKRVAHPTGGTIAAIYVRDGDRVRKGDILVRLDDKVSSTDARLSERSVGQLLAQRARLEAERLGSGTMQTPAELSAQGGTDAMQALADEKRLFAIKNIDTTRMRAQIAARIAQYQQQIGGYRARIASYHRQLDLIHPELESVRTLWKRGLVTISRLNQLERTAAELEGAIASTDTDIAQAQARITESQAQLLQLAETRRSEAGTQLAAVNATLNQQQVRSASAGDQQDRSVIRAPYDGVVDKIAFSTIGDVVRPAETIMEIVPDDDKLVVEAMISPTDRDQVHAGQKVRIRFTAFNAATTPEVAGTVLVVAPERSEDERSRESFYAVRIRTDAQAMTKLSGIRLVSGMPAEVFIETGRRSMLSYIVKPLHDQLERAFRDG